MKHYDSIRPMTGKVNEVKKKGKTIGFVPTMGFLHEGHTSLIKKAVKETDFVAVSIFVNPIQFGPNEDFKVYPRDLGRDLRVCRRTGVDAVFSVQPDSMYEKGFSTYVSVEGVTEGLCGANRPGHFKGVSTVVAKLFNIVRPDIAYFGQKDAQQAVVIRRMVRDLNIPVRIKVLPIVREEDGLAMSSRNSYLSREERAQALSIYSSLKLARRLYRNGERDAKRIIRDMRKEILEQSNIEVDYISIVDPENLRPVDRVSKGALIAVAAKVGRTRLIDNIVLN